MKDIFCMAHLFSFLEDIKNVRLNESEIEALMGQFKDILQTEGIFLRFIIWQYDSLLFPVNHMIEAILRNNIINYEKRLYSRL